MASGFTWNGWKTYLAIWSSIIKSTQWIVFFLLVCVCVCVRTFAHVRPWRYSEFQFAAVPRKFAYIIDFFHQLCEAFLRGIICMRQSRYVSVWVIDGGVDDSTTKIIIEIKTKSNKAMLELVKHRLLTTTPTKPTVDASPSPIDHRQSNERWRRTTMNGGPLCAVQSCCACLSSRLFDSVYQWWYGSETINSIAKFQLAARLFIIMVSFAYIIHISQCL